MLADFGRLHRNTKTLFEEMTCLQRRARDSQSDAEKFGRTLQAIQAEMRHEVRAAYGAPGHRLLANPQYRARINAACRIMSTSSACSATTTRWR